MRRPLLILAVMLTTCVSEASAAAAPPGPLSVLGGVSSSGYPMAGSGPSGVAVRFIDRGTFWVAVLVRNTSRKPVTLVGASTPEPRNSLVRQTRAGFSAYTPCSGHVMCSWPSKPTSTAPLTLAAHAEAAVKLSYQLVSCNQAAVSSTASGRSLVLRYRYGHGSVGTETIPLGGARLRLERPAGIECLPRPYSHIGLVGSFTTSPGHRPIPGSDGDTCTRTSTGGLAFRSREFMDRSGVAFRIEIDLPHYRGRGSYHRRHGTLGPAEVGAIGGFGLHGWTSFHDLSATVTVTTARESMLGGRFSAIFSGHRRFFRAYGAWRCTTLR